MFEFTPGRTPLIISFPHSGTVLPMALCARMTPAALAVADTDWFVPELYAFARDIGAATLVAGYSRYCVDLNRPPDGAPLYPGQRETEVCPSQTFAGEPIYRSGVSPDKIDIAQRLDAYWLPYHQRLAGAIDAIKAQYGRCILWDAHSIRSRVPMFFDGRLPDLNLGTAGGTSCSASLMQRLVAHLERQQRFSFVVNGRFKGGYITRKYGAPGADVDAIQMEIAQCAYMNENRKPMFDPAQAHELQSLLRDLLQELIAAA